MSEQNSFSSDAGTTPIRDLDYAQARLAYSIIETLLEHTGATNDLIALMAQALDEDTKHALTNTPIWTAYLESRRGMEKARASMEQFTEIMKRLAEDDEPAHRAIRT